LQLFTLIFEKQQIFITKVKSSASNSKLSNLIYIFLE